VAEVTSRDLHIDALLTNMSIGYKNDLYIADSIAPIVPVMKQSDIIPKYDQSHWFRNQANIRAPGTLSQRGGYTVDTSSTYYCPRYSFGFEIPDETRDNTDAPYDLDRDGTAFVTDRLMMMREVTAATRFFTTGLWGADVTPAVLWSTYGTSTPLVDITTYQDAVEGRIARMPNKFIMGKQVFSILKWHPDLMDKIKYTQRGVVTTDLLAALIDMETVLIGRAIFTASAEGTAEGSVVYNRIWGKNALLIHVPSAPSLMTAAAAYTFTWNRVPNSIQYFTRKRNDEREVDILEGNTYFDQRITSSRAGQFISAPVA
jgi:hypothetical protein